MENIKQRLSAERDADRLLEGEHVWFLDGCLLYQTTIERLGGEWEREDGTRELLGYYIRREPRDEPEFHTRPYLFRLPSERLELIERMESSINALESYLSEVREDR